MNLGPREYLHAGCGAFGFQHPQNVFRRPVAEKLSRRLLVIGDAMLFDQSDEVRRRIPGQRRFYEVWIRGEEIFRLAVSIGEVTSAAAGDEDFLARAIGMLDHRDAASASASLRRAHQPGGAAAKNQGIELLIHCRRVVHFRRPIGGRFYCTARPLAARALNTISESLSSRRNVMLFTPSGVSALGHVLRRFRRRRRRRRRPGRSGFPA